MQVLILFKKIYIPDMLIMSEKISRPYSFIMILSVI